jgi:plasmid stability protein
MASLTIRHLDDSTKARLKARAEEHGRSMEDEARQIIEHAVAEEEPYLVISDSVSTRDLPAWAALICPNWSANLSANRRPSSDDNRRYQRPL